jgi:hypothetical protein
VICGCPVKNISKAKWLMVSASSSCFLTPKEVEHCEDAGAFPIGNGCLRKYKKELEKYLNGID